MKFYDHYCYQINTELNQTEQFLKEIWQREQDRHLEQPHEFAYVEQILRPFAEHQPDSFMERLFQFELEEEAFFQKNMDVAVYQHLRYLPAYWHSHSFLEVVCVLEGSCTNYILEQSLSMQAGDICIIAPDTRHTISACSDDCILFNLLLRMSTFETAFFGTLAEDDILSEFFTHILFHSATHPYLYFCTGEDRELRNFIGYLYEEYHAARQYKNRMMDNLVMAFFIILLRKHSADVILPELGQEDNPDLVYILKYMQEHYRTVTMKELAAFFHYSERHLQRLIQKGTGRSFHENILNRKMRRAGDLLKAAERSVPDIAQELGYADTGSFRAAFKKYYGRTPQEYRMKLGAEKTVNKTSETWNGFASSLSLFSDDFMEEGREQPEQQNRELL